MAQRRELVGLAHAQLEADRLATSVCAPAPMMLVEWCADSARGATAGISEATVPSSATASSETSLMKPGASEALGGPPVGLVPWGGSTCACALHEAIIDDTAGPANMLEVEAKGDPLILDRSSPVPISMLDGSPAAASPTWRLVCD